jgi:tRNA C32,U32 (ribose-2'-O)-methylase TrmJ
MTKKHKPRESKAERELRRILEHNTKIMRESHIDFNKASKEVGERFRRVTATFSDKEMQVLLLVYLLLLFPL